MRFRPEPGLRLAVCGFCLTVTALALAPATSAGAGDPPVPPSDRYAVNLSLGYRPADSARRALRLAREAGAGLVHLTFFWAVAQPRPGPFTWDAFEPVVAEAREQGMELLG